MPTDPRPHAPAPADGELAAYLENTPLAVIAWDRAGRVSRWTGQAERVFGWTAAEAVGRPSFDVIPPHPDDLARVTEHVAGLWSARRPHTSFRNRNLTRDGRVVWCEWYNSVLFDPAGAPASALSLVLDVTDRVAAEGAAVRAEARLRQTLGGARMVGWEWNYATQRVTATAPLGEYFGAPPGRDYGTWEGAWSVIHPDDLALVERAVGDAVRSGGEFRVEYRGSAPAADGTPRWFSTRGQVEYDADATPALVLGVTTEITDRKRAERDRAALDQQLLDAQKWESLGVLAGGIAHDFNNILTVVLGSAGLARRHLPPDSPADPLLGQIEEAVGRAAGLCREMLAYAGRGGTPAGAADLGRLVRDSAGLLAVTSARHEPVRVEIAPALPPVRADEGPVRRVLVNLVMNAGEAVGDGGRVTVRAAAAEVTGAEPPGWFRLAPPPGRYVRLDVADTGPGIAPDVLAKMFDPFVTTRFPGRGLGLSAVLGIVKSHGGGIRVVTAPGRGTTVEVYWPAAGPVPDAAPPVPVLPPPPPAPTPVPARRAGGIALVVDDEMFIREVAASILEDLGYAPLLAGDGVSGLELFRVYRGAVRVVVLDVVMPGLTGDRVLAAIRAESPDTPVVLVSGYTDRRTPDPADAGGRTTFLRKPFRPEELAEAVRAVVAAPA